MDTSDFLRRISCNDCDWTRVWGPAEMKQELQRLGMQKRDAKPDFDLILELFRVQIGSITCPECSAAGLSISIVDDSDADWGDARACELCGSEIPSERLEIFPDSVRCAACQDKPSTPTSDDFCPRCGGIWQMSSSGGAGVSRYVMRCPGCGFRG